MDASRPYLSALLQCAVGGDGDTGVNRAKLLFVSPDILLQRLQQTLGMSRRQDDARNQLAKRRGVLLYKKVIEYEFLFCMPDIGYVGERAFENFRIQVYLDLVVAGLILRRIHAAQKRQAYCLTTTKKKYHRTMLRKLRLLLPVSALLALAPACVETYYDSAERVRYSSEYGEPTLPTRDQFIGSVYFPTASAQLTRAAAVDLARMAGRINERRHAGLRVVLVGYADRRRGVEENSELATERAQKVAIALEKHGVEFERILLDNRPVRLSRGISGERRVDIYLERRALAGNGTLYPILVTFFLFTAFIVAVLVFRRRR